MPAIGCLERAERNAGSGVRFESVDPADPRARELTRALDDEVRARAPDEPVFGIENDGFVDAGGIFLLVHQDRMLAGCGALRPFDERIVEVKRMYMLPAFRGAGLSRTLLLELENIAREQRFSIVNIETGEHNTEALGLYWSNGYRPIPRYGEYLDCQYSICFGKPCAAAEDVAFLDAFEDCSLAESDWTHLAHVRVAWHCLNAASPERALARIRAGILRYNTEVLHRRHKYHETVTVAFARLIAERMRPDQPWNEFVAKNGDLLDTWTRVLSPYFSDATLGSEKAQQEFVVPDLQQLPELPQHQR